MMKPVQQKGPDSLGQPNKQVGPGTSPIKGGPTNQGPQKSLLGQGPPNQNNQGGPLKPAGQGGPPPNAATGGPNQNKGPAGAQIQNQGSSGPQNQSKGPGGPQNPGSGGPQNQSKGPGGPQNPGSGGPQNQSRGPQQGSGGPQNRGPGGPQNQGSGGPQNQNQGSGGPPNQNRGPGGPQNQNRGPGGPQNQNRGPGGPQNQSMGQGGFQNQNRGQGGPQNQNMGQGGRQMGPGNSEGVSPRGGPGPRGPNQGQGGGQDGPRGPNQNRGGGDRRPGGRGPQDRRGGYGEEGQGMHEGSSGRDGNGPRRGGQGGMYNMKQEQMRHAQFAGPTHTLPSKEGEEVKKFTGRCRLFVGNLSHEIDEEEFKKLFDSYGEVSEVYINKQKGFGFIKMDTRSNAETAKNSLDNTQLKGHTLRVRFASSGTAIKVKNLSNMVSNELLEYAFSMFGEIDRAIVLVDERGRPSGEGIVEFSRKNKAAQTLRRCQEDCFMITNSPRPVVVEPYEEKDQEDGLPERMLPSHSQQFMKERDVGPRLAMPNSFEYEFGQRWKQLYELEKQKKEQLDREIQEDRERLEEQMEFAIYEQETNILREQLRQREEEANALLREKEMRIQQQERLREQHRLRQEEMLRQRQESLGVGGLGGLGGNAAGGMGHGGGGGGDDMRRRQEDNLMMQANQLNTLLEQQEAAMRNIQGGGNNSGNMGGGGNIGGGGNMGGGMDAANGLGGSANTKGVAVDTNRNVGGISGPVGSQQRQSRFDQPNQGGMGGGPNGPPLAGGPMNRGGMGAPGLMGPGGPNAGMNERGGMVRSMEFRDQRDEGYPNDIKRRRF